MMRSLMVLLDHDKVTTYAEIRRIAEVETAFSLNYGLVISLFPVACKKYSVSYGGVYLEARKDGLIV
jgi:hypothetical protein